MPESDLSRRLPAVHRHPRLYGKRFVEVSDLDGIAGGGIGIDLHRVFARREGDVRAVQHDVGNVARRCERN